MITEETFPSDFDNFEDLEDSAFVTNDGSNKDHNSTDNICKGFSFSSAESSFGVRNLPPIPPRAPMKKKRYQSCQDLVNRHNNYRSKNYAHVESKVKKFIDENADALADRRKTLIRHKSMPEKHQTLQLRDDDQLKDEVDINILKSELFKRSHHLTDLVQHNSNRVLMLEIEKTQLKVTIDALRMELHNYKEKERDIKERSTASSMSDLSHHRSLRSVRDIDVQTDYSELSPSISSPALLDVNSTYRCPKPTINIYRDSCEDLKKKRVTINELSHAQRFDNPLIRELSYNMTEEDIQSYNTQNGMSLSSNISTDLLLSTSETPLCQPTDESEGVQIKKKKKLKHRLMKLMSCVSSK